MVINTFEESALDIFFGVLLALVALIVDQYLTLSNSPFVHYFYKPIMLASFIVSIVGRHNLSIFVKTFITCMFFIWGVYWSLFGRTVNVGLTIETSTAAFASFFFLSYIILFFPLDNLWRGKARSILVHLIPLASIITALVIADVEERVFMSLHPDGIGPTRRWSVNIAWMAYEPEKIDSPAILSGGN